MNRRRTLVAVVPWIDLLRQDASYDSCCGRVGNETIFKQAFSIGIDSGAPLHLQLYRPRERRLRNRYGKMGIVQRLFDPDWDRCSVCAGDLRPSLSSQGTRAAVPLSSRNLDVEYNSCGRCLVQCCHLPVRCVHERVHIRC